jgi:hypothetical protein
VLLYIIEAKIKIKKREEMKINYYINKCCCFFFFFSFFFIIYFVAV